MYGEIMNEEGQIGEDERNSEPSNQPWSQQQPEQEPPEQQQPPAQQQYSQHPPQGRPPQRESFLKRMTDTDNLSKIISLGFILILIGMLLIHVAPFATNWGASQYDDNMPDMTEEEKADDRATQNAMEYLGTLIRDIGIFMIGLILILGSIFKDDLDNKYRMLMFSLAILFVLVAWFGFLTSIPISFAS